MKTKKKKSFLNILTGSKKSSKIKKSKIKIKPMRSKLAQKKLTQKQDKQSEGQLAIDVFQKSDAIVIKSTIAGAEPGNLDINITGDMLTIKGIREHDENVKTSDYYYQECYWGPFSRSIILPVEVNANKIKADLKNGILTICLPKSQKEQTKKIEVVAK